MTLCHILPNPRGLVNRSEEVKVHHRKIIITFTQTKRFIRISELFAYTYIYIYIYIYIYRLQIAIYTSPVKYHGLTLFYDLQEKRTLRINIKFTIFQTTNNLTIPPKMTSDKVESDWANIGGGLHHLIPEIRRIVRRLERLHL